MKIREKITITLLLRLVCRKSESALRKDGISLGIANQTFFIVVCVAGEPLHRAFSSAAQSTPVNLMHRNNYDN